MSGPAVSVAQTSQQLLSLFTDSAIDYSLFTLDAEGRINSWNRGAERLYGYHESEIIGQSMDCFLTVDEQSRLDAGQELKIAAEQGSYEAERWRQRKDGSRIGVYLVITPLRDAGQTLSGYAVVTRDVSEIRRTLLEIQDQKRRLRSILDTAVDAFVIIDEHGNIESINPAGQRMFGYQEDEVIGQNVRMLMPEPFAAEHTSYIQRYLRTGNAKIIGIGREVQAKRKDGTLFPADLAVSAFYDGKALFTGVLRDVSERKAMQSEVLQIAEAEQRRIGQELHDDAQQQLSALTMIARNTADSITPFLTQTPELATVQAKVERLARGLREANQSLREVARGLVPLQIDAHGLRDALERLATQVSETQELTCQCVFDKAVDVEDAVAATHLYRIAQEAVNNSLKHGSASRIEISLKVQREMLTLEIVDNGAGISESDDRRGRGLQIMGYRAGLIGAVLSVRRAGSTGTIVSCSLPRTTTAAGQSPPKS